MTEISADRELIRAIRAGSFFFTAHGWKADGSQSEKSLSSAAPLENLVGEYDGEGTMWGTWTSDEGAGAWLIRVFGEVRPPDHEATGAALARMDRAGIYIKRLAKWPCPFFPERTKMKRRIRRILASRPSDPPAKSTFRHHGRDIRALFARHIMVK